MNQQEWRNQAALANYPFASDASRNSLTRSSTLKTSDIVDAHLIAREPGEVGFHISRLEISSVSLSGTIESSLGFFGTFSIPIAELPDGVARVVDEVGIDRGLICFGREDQELFDLLTTGESLFPPGALEFHEGVIFQPPSSRVATIRINDFPLYGRVRLKAGTGIRFQTLSDASGRDVVVIHAIGAQVEKDCGFGKPIKNFNSVPPNEYGSILIRPSPHMTPEDATSLRQILRIRAADDQNGIVISIAELNN